MKLELRVSEGKMKEKSIIKKEEGKYRIVFPIHNFDKRMVSYPVAVEWSRESITVESSSEGMEIIKTTLLRRDTPEEIIWSIIQHEYRVIDRVEEKVEKLQNSAVHHYSSTLVRDILAVKKMLFSMHRDYMRLRNTVEALRDENILPPRVSVVLRDINELIYGVEYLIDATTVAIQLMQNTLSFKINKSMNILTIIATIMMPLTLITGIYGMNFRNMPEIYWHYGYYYSLLLMLSVALIMIYYFKKKKLF